MLHRPLFIRSQFARSLSRLFVLLWPVKVCACHDTLITLVHLIVTTRAVHTPLFVNAMTTFAPEDWFGGGVQAVVACGLHDGYTKRAERTRGRLHREREVRKTVRWGAKGNSANLPPSHELLSLSQTQRTHPCVFGHRRGGALFAKSGVVRHRCGLVVGLGQDRVCTTSCRMGSRSVEAQGDS